MSVYILQFATIFNFLYIELLVPVSGYFNANPMEELNEYCF